MGSREANEDAAQRVRAHHRQMVEEFDHLVDDFAEQMEGACPPDADRQQMVDYIDQVILPHAAAEEATIYVQAQRSGFGLQALVEDMKHEHSQLLALRATLAESPSGVQAIRAAGGIEQVFSSHAGRENDLLLPVLSAAQDVDLPALLEQLHQLTSSAKEDTAAIEDVTLDVRLIPHQRRHTAIFAVVDHLAVGQSVTIEVDHDPLPLRYQMEASHGAAMSWTYLEQGPTLWRVQIRRTKDDGSKAG